MTLTPFMRMFGQSPLRPLQKHIICAYEAAEQLNPFFEEVLCQNWQKSEAIQQNIVMLENKADGLKKEIRGHVPKSLFLPVARGDLLAILSAQDKIANQAKDIAGLIQGRKMVFPEVLQPLFQDLIARCVAACKQAQDAIKELDELFESGFRGNEIYVIEDMINRLDELEHETDDIQAVLRQELFKIESQLPPVEVIFLYKAVDFIGALADRAHDVGGKLQVVLAH